MPSTQKYGSAESRWAGVGPYYAMFPTAFADAVVKEYTQQGDTVLDPFAGRGTAVYSAAVQCRSGIGIEINPLGYVYANAKLKTGKEDAVANRLEELSDVAGRYDEEADELSEFFHSCYSKEMREFLLAVRANLDWRRKRVDCTLMALILVSLHGKTGQSLSNQMRQSTAMAPDYSVKWWRKKGMKAPEVDPVAFLKKRIEWRYVHGCPNTRSSDVFLGDSKEELPRLESEAREGKRTKANLLLTSPPYHNVTNYYFDQWLRLWLLGGPVRPSSRTSNHYGGKHSNSRQHLELLDQVFCNSKPLLAEDAVVYVRTDRREPTYRNTLQALKRNFPEKNIAEVSHPLDLDHQLKPYSRGGAPKQANCEVDLILEPQ